MRYDLDSIRKRKKRMSILRILFVIIIIVVLYNILLLVITSANDAKNWSLFGYQAYAVTSNSMEPEINIGDVVIVRTCKEEDIHENDIITFYQNGYINTHRVAEIVDMDGKKFITKGDNNNAEDSKEVEFADIKGKVIMKIPFLGSVINFLQDRLIILIIILILLLLLLWKIVKDERKENRRIKKEIEKEKNR